MKRNPFATSNVEATLTAPTSADSPAGAHHSRARFAIVAAQTGRTLWSLITWPFDWLRDFYGVEEMSGLLINGEIVDPCDLCSDPSSDYVDGHAPGVQCPRAQVAACAECLQMVDVDRFGHCVVGGGKHFTYGHRPKPQPISQLYIVKS